MTEIKCGECEGTFEVETLSDATENPRNGEALCDSCSQVSCKNCHLSLNLVELTDSHAHESGGWVCDTCPRKDYPFEFTLTFRREPEGYIPSHMDEVFPDLRLSDDYNADAISRDWWRYCVHVTFRVDSSGMTPVALDGNYVEGYEPL